MKFMEDNTTFLGVTIDTINELKNVTFKNNDIEIEDSQITEKVHYLNIINFKALTSFKINYFCILLA
jgi:hypothetical protein